MAGPAWSGPEVVVSADGSAVALSSFSEDGGPRFRRAALDHESVDGLRRCAGSDDFELVPAADHDRKFCVVADASSFSLVAGPASGRPTILRSSDVASDPAGACRTQVDERASISGALTEVGRLVRTQGELTDPPPDDVAPR